MLKIHNKQKEKNTSNISVKIFIFLFFIGTASNVVGQEKYEVISTSRLNVRNKPTTNSSIIGTLNPHEQIDVYSIIDSWAKISYRSRMAYVSSKYIRKIEIKENIPIVTEILGLVLTLLFNLSPINLSALFLKTIIWKPL